MAPVGSWHILRRREMIILVRRFYISASCASHASCLTLMLCSFPSFTATPLTWTNRILTHWYCNYYPYHFHLRWQHFSNWLMLILIKGMFSCFVFLMKRGKKLLLKEPISPLFAYTHGRPGLTERKWIFVTLHEQKATCETKSDALHVQVNSYIKFLTHIAKYVLMKMLFNPFYSYANSVIVCSRHLFSGGEREKKVAVFTINWFTPTVNKVKNDIGKYFNFFSPPCWTDKYHWNWNVLHESPSHYADVQDRAINALHRALI